MLVVLSPAKRLDFSSRAKTTIYSQPIFLKEAKTLVAKLKKFGPEELSELMGISKKLAEENAWRYSEVKFPFNLNNAKQAAFAFKGDTYQGLSINKFSQDDLFYAQLRLRILSGLFGILSPLDLIFPYRLEMGTNLSVGGHKDLYSFWKDKVTANLNEMDSSYLVNCASTEYFSVIDAKKLKAEVVTPVFLDREKGSKEKYKIIGIFAKAARGMMARFIIQERIKEPKNLREFDFEGYVFDQKESKESKPVFKREYKRKS